MSMSTAKTHLIAAKADVQNHQLHIQDYGIRLFLSVNFTVLEFGLTVPIPDPQVQSWWKELEAPMLKS